MVVVCAEVVIPNAANRTIVKNHSNSFHFLKFKKLINVENVENVKMLKEINIVKQNQ